MVNEPLTITHKRIIRFVMHNLLDILLLAFIFEIVINHSAYGQIKIKAVGDIMLGSVTPKKILPASSGIFEKSIGSYLNNADLVFGNLEGAFINNTIEPVKCTDSSRAAGRCYEFGMPVSLAPVLSELGFSIMNLDNNHSEDYGKPGFNFTVSTLSSLNIKPLVKKGFAISDVDGIEIAFIPFGFSGASNNVSDLASLTRIVKQYKSRYKIVIVSFHGGAEGKTAAHVKDSSEVYLGENRGNIFRFAHTAIEAGADLVIGHGPHVLRGIEFYKNKLIAYSLGNFLTYGNVNITGTNGITAIFSITLDNRTGNFIRGKIIPVIQIGRGVPVYDKSGEAIKLIKKLSLSDFPGSNIVITNSGMIYPVPGPKIKMRNISELPHRKIKRLLETVGLPVWQKFYSGE